METKVLTFKDCSQLTKKAEVIKSNAPVSDKDSIDFAADFSSCWWDIPLMCVGSVS